MSAQTAIQTQLTPPMREFADSLTERAAANAAIGLEVVNSHLAREPSVKAPPATLFIEPATIGKSRFGKSGVFAIVVLGHALAFYTVAKMPDSVKQAILEPLQVVMIDAPETPQELPPPVPTLRQEVAVPIEPVINVAEPENTKSIAVATLTESTSNGPQSFGAPKVVSSVEYVREPAAKYPPAARALKQRGTVTLRCLVGIDGKANEVNVYHSSGSHLLDDAGRTAVLNALFKPYTENGRVIPVYVLVPIEFGASGSLNSAS